MFFIIAQKLLKMRRIGLFHKIMFYRALKKDIKFILLIKSLYCLYLSIFLNVNKKINLWDYWKKI